MTIIFIFNISIVTAQCLDGDIMVIADFSGSVKGYETEIFNSVDALCQRFSNTSDNVRIGVIGFATLLYDISELSHNIDSVRFNVNKYRNYLNGDGLTYLSGAIEYSTKVLLQNREIGRDMIMIIISDGNPNSRYRTTDEAEYAKSVGIKICVVYVPSSLYYYEQEETGIYRKKTSIYLQSISTDNCYSFVDDYKNLENNIKNFQICF